MKIVKLCDLPIEWKRGTGLRKSDVIDDGNNYCVLYGELFTKHKSILIDNDKISRTNNHGSVVSKCGDVLIPGTSTASKYDMVLAREINKDGIFIGGDVNIIRPKDGLFAQKYLAYFFETASAHKQLEKYITGTTGIIHISNSGIKNLEVPLFSKEKQLVLVDRLDAAFEKIDRAIDLTERNIRNSTALFSSKMHEHFDNNDKVNVNYVKFTEVCKEIFAGGDVPVNRSSKVETDKYTIPIYTNGERNNGLYGFTDIVRVDEPSVTVSARGTIGFTAIRRESFYPAVRLIVLTPDIEKVDIDYLDFAAKSLTFLNTGSSIPQLTVPMIKTYDIPLPDLNLQKNIARELMEIRDKTNNLVKIYKIKKAYLLLFKQSLLTQTFSRSDVE